MDWLPTLAIRSALSIAYLFAGYVAWPLAKFAAGYLIYMLTGAFITFIWKLRHEYHNEDLKLTSNQIKNRLLLITGAGSGIGLALVKHFLKRGFSVAACYYTKDEPGYKELQELAKFKSNQRDASKLNLIQLDIKSLESIESCYTTVKEILARDGNLQLHALLNVAGIGIFQKFQWTPMTTIQNLVDTNLTGSMLVARQFLHLLLESPCGRIVNVASPIGLIPIQYSAVYAPTKTGLTHFSSVLESETTARHPHLKVVTIQPGNLMQNTSIIRSSLSQKTDGVLEGLNAEEKDLYEDELVQHQRLLERTERDFRRRRPFKDLRPMRKLVTIVSGGILEEKLEDSISFVQSFDNSVCLRDPPREMFAGNLIFNLVVGSLIQWAPRIILRDFVLSNLALITWSR